LTIHLLSQCGDAGTSGSTRLLSKTARKGVCVTRANPLRAHYNRSTYGYDQEGPGLSISTSGTLQIHIKGGKSEDELQLVLLDLESLPGSIGEGMKDAKMVVMVTRDVSVTAT